MWKWFLFCLISFCNATYGLLLSAYLNDKKLFRSQTTFQLFGFSWIQILFQQLAHFCFDNRILEFNNIRFYLMWYYGIIFNSYFDWWYYNLVLSIIKRIMLYWRTNSISWLWIYRDKNQSLCFFLSNQIFIKIKKKVNRIKKHENEFFIRFQ